MRNPVSAVIFMSMAIFLIALGVFYFKEGSFEGAGAKMDTKLVELKNETSDAMSDAGEATKRVVDDIADGDGKTTE